MPGKAHDVIHEPGVGRDQQPGIHPLVKPLRQHGARAMHRLFQQGHWPLGLGQLCLQAREFFFLNKRLGSFLNKHLGSFLNAFERAFVNRCLHQRLHIFRHTFRRTAQWCHRPGKSISHNPVP